MNEINIIKKVIEAIKKPKPSPIGFVRQFCKCGYYFDVRKGSELYFKAWICPNCSTKNYIDTSKSS